MNKRETVIKHEDKVYTVKTEDIGRTTKQEVGVSVVGKTEFKSWDEPTLFEINSACFSYRHDFGLLSEDEKNLTRWLAKEWLHAWRKELNE